MKIFIIYYLISGVITAHYTQIQYDSLIKKYPSFEWLNKNFILFIQFFLGFSIFPLWFPHFLYTQSRRYYVKYCNRLRENLPKPSAKEIFTDNRTKEQREKDFQESIKKTIAEYGDNLKDVIDWGGKNYQSLYFFFDEEEDDINMIKWETIKTFDENNDIKALTIIIKENYYVIVPSNLTHLMEGWQTACIITNTQKK
jgi:hypothetical protein